MPLASRLSFALVASVLIHGLLGLAVAVCLEWAPDRRQLPTLDLSCVELTLSDEDEASPDDAPPSPAQSAGVAVSAPRRVELPSPEVREIRCDPPAPSVAKLREPVVRPAHFSPPTNPSSARQQAKVDAPPSPEHAIRPDYPSRARRRGEQGDVVVEIDVSAAGRVDRVRVVESCGFRELDEAAVKAVRAATFRPARRGAEPMASAARLKLSFRLK